MLTLTQKLIAGIANGWLGTWLMNQKAALNIGTLGTQVFAEFSLSKGELLRWALTFWIGSALKVVINLYFFQCTSETTHAPIVHFISDGKLESENEFGLYQAISLLKEQHNLGPREEVQP